MPVLWRLTWRAPCVSETLAAPQPSAGHEGLGGPTALLPLPRAVNYSLIYWTTVGRVSDQVATPMKSARRGSCTLVGPTASTFDLSTTGFWARGVNVGFEYQF